MTERARLFQAETEGSRWLQAGMKGAQKLQALTDRTLWLRTRIEGARLLQFGAEDWWLQPRTEGARRVQDGTEVSLRRKKLGGSRLGRIKLNSTRMPPMAQFYVVRLDSSI